MFVPYKDATVLVTAEHALQIGSHREHRYRSRVHYRRGPEQRQVSLLRDEGVNPDANAAVPVPRHNHVMGVDPLCATRDGARSDAVRHSVRSPLRDQQVAVDGPDVEARASTRDDLASDVVDRNGGDRALVTDEAGQLPHVAQPVDVPQDASAILDGKVSDEVL